jgi:hypothetical protein
VNDTQQNVVDIQHINIVDSHTQEDVERRRAARTYVKISTREALQQVWRFPTMEQANQVQILGIHLRLDNSIPKHIPGVPGRLGDNA